MEVTILFFLSSGLFLGWSLGANDAANVFGTAVGSKMIKFSTAALICSVFVIIGAVISGAGASHTLGKLGAINTLAGAFTVALSAAVTVLIMTRLGLPVSTSQAIVGAIIGWNFFSGFETDPKVISKIMMTWVLCPVLALIFSSILFWITKFIVEHTKIHLIRLDSYTRILLILAGAFGSYSLGANNIANVMGVFVSSTPFKDISLGSLYTLTGAQQLFALGGIAIAIGVYTYSRKVMMTVGSNIFKLSPIAALVVVLSSSFVLFLFASQSLHDWFVSHGIPPIPLVPVSSSQAAVGAVIGIGIAKGGRNVNYRVLGRISLGWISTPIIAGIFSFITLFVMQNVFMTKVFS
ncbi:MAG: inorganic phosphate transporter [Bacteriovoracaceae bacterium]|nr:inorganic phosphate transporter [Bacteriovoracaceae bacterium]